MVHPMRVPEQKSGYNIRRALYRELEWFKTFKKYDIHNKQISYASIAKQLRYLMNINKIPRIIKSRYGLILKATPLRKFPTEKMIMKKPDDAPFDILKFTTLYTGEEVTLFHFSKDKRWAFVQSTHGYGWIRMKDIAWTYHKEVVNSFLHPEKFIVSLDWMVPVFVTKNHILTYTFLWMGCQLPMEKEEDHHYIVKIPVRSFSGRLRFKNAYVKKRKNVSVGYLKLTPRNISEQAFRMLGTPYSWGGGPEGTDCSSFLRRVFLCMGLNLPRSSISQMQLLRTIPVKGRNKHVMLNHLPSFGTFLYHPGPGHIMLYIGKYKNRHYVIHNKWSYTVRINGKEKEKYLKKVVVSDLFLEKESSSGSLYRKISRISLLGARS